MFYILAVLFIFRRDSDSLFVFEEASSSSSMVVDEVLQLICLFSLELAARRKGFFDEEFWIKYLMFLIF